MSTQEEARKAAAKQRQDEKHLHQSMLSRSEEELEAERHSSVTEESRELMAGEHQYEKHLQQTMLQRAAAELGVPQDAEDPANQ